MTTKYDPPSIDDAGPSFTSDEIYDSEVGKKFTEALEEQKIEKCFEEIKQVLVKYRCEITLYKNEIELYHNDYGLYYKQKDFNK